MTQPEITFVIPTLNEKDTIESLILEILELFRDVSVEIVVVDDESPDGTADIVRHLGKKFPVRLISKKREGIGAALRVGYDQALGKYIASIDADKSFDTVDLRRLYSKIQEGHDLVTANFHSRESVYEIPDFNVWVRHFFSANGNRLICLLTGLKLGTFTSNLRIIRNDAWQQIETKENSNTLMLEMIVKVHRKNLRITEIPVCFRIRKFGKSKMRLGSQTARFLKSLIFYRFSS